MRHSSKSADLNGIARELALDAVLGLFYVGISTHIPGISNRLMSCHERGPPSRTFRRSPLSACCGSRIQIGIVGSQRPQLRSKEVEHWQEISHRRGTEAARVSHTVFLVVALIRVQLGTQLRSLHASQARVGSQPACAAW